MLRADADADIADAAIFAAFAFADAALPDAILLRHDFITPPLMPPPRFHLI